MAKLYDKNGFPDFEKMHKLSSTLNIVLAARSTGKTYGKLLYNHQHDIPYIYMRTNDRALNEIFNDKMSPFEKLNRDIGTHYTPAKFARSSVIGIYEDFTINSKGKKIVTGEPKNYALSLTAVGSIRGFTLDDIDEVVYDEFVRHKGEHIINYGQQADVYFDILFSVSRDRELRGRKPIKQWLLGNSDNLNVPILYTLNLIEAILKLKKSKENYLRIPEKDISIFILDDSPRAKLLGELTTLAKITAGTDYAKMAFENDFVYDDFDNCAPQPIIQYKPLFCIAGIMVMEHKSKSLWYVRPFDSAKINGIPVYSATDRGYAQCRESFAYLRWMYLDSLIYFRDYSVKIIFKKIFNLDNL